MAHVPIPEAVRDIRAASITNAAALRSVSAQVLHHLEHVDAFPNTPAKGQLRDGLMRLAARYDISARLNDRMVALSGVVLDMLGTTVPAEPDPTPAPAPTTWSTGSW